MKFGHIDTALTTGYNSPLIERSQEILRENKRSSCVRRRLFDQSFTAGDTLTLTSIWEM